MLKTGNFKYKATIDWIELEVTTIDTSNFHAIMKFANSTNVEGINPGDCGETNRFFVKFHDVTSWVSLENKIKDFNDVKPLSEVYISGVEVSFDAYSNNNDKDELVEKTAEFYWLLQLPSSKNRRLASNFKGSAVQPVNHLSNIRNIMNGHTIYIGSQSDDAFSQRIYYKTKDNNKLLPIEEHRARYELTLKGDACPFRTIEDAKAYKFCELKKWFKFRKIKDDLDSFRLMLTNATMQLGIINIPRRIGGGVMVNAIGTQADIVLNRIAYDKLRELTKRLQKTRVLRKLRVTH